MNKPDFTHIQYIAKDGRGWDRYAWPGGYPMYYLTEDGGVLSPSSANENFELTLGDDPQWRIVAADINWEDQHLYCDHSNDRIECAYSDD